MDKEIINLFKKFINDRCSSADLERVLNYLENGKFIEEWNTALKDEEKESINEPSLRRMDARRKDELHGYIQNKIQKRRTIPLWLRYSSAALLLLALSVTLLLYNNPGLPLGPGGANSGDVKPGGNVATLTLADGRAIRLDNKGNGNLAYQGNSAIVKLAEGELIYKRIGAGDEQEQYNTLSTPRGGQYQITLPDGTRAWLNAASSIIYPTAFAGNKRQVTIKGEVYFEVMPDKSKPFIVSSAGQTIEVLGTHFNVNAYEDESVIKTTLLEGRVRVSLPSKSSSILFPGQQSEVVKGEDYISLSRADTEAAIGWKNGEIHFSNTDLKGVLRQLARWYDVDVDFRGMPDKKLNGVISRKVNLSAVLQAIEKTSNIPLKIENLPGEAGRRISME